MRFFKKADPAAHPMAQTPLWLVPLHIRSGTEALPQSMAGAYVRVFCGAPDANIAAWTSIQAIEAMGYSVPENPSTVEMMPASDYEAFIAAQWPEVVTELPAQAELYERLADNRVVLGPIAGYSD